MFTHFCHPPPMRPFQQQGVLEWVNLDPFCSLFGLSGMAGNNGINYNNRFMGEKSKGRHEPGCRSFLPWHESCKFCLQIQTTHGL